MSNKICTAHNVDGKNAKSNGSSWVVVVGWSRSVLTGIWLALDPVGLYADDSPLVTDLRRRLWASRVNLCSPCTSPSCSSSS